MDTKQEDRPIGKRRHKRSKKSIYKAEIARLLDAIDKSYRTSERLQTEADRHMKNIAAVRARTDEKMVRLEAFIDRLASAGPSDAQFAEREEETPRLKQENARLREERGLPPDGDLFGLSW